VFGENRFFMAKKLTGMVVIALMLLGLTLFSVGCNHINDYSDGDAPFYFDEQYLFLKVGETADLNIREIFKHSGININKYSLRSSSEWVASVKNETVTALRAGNQSIGFIGHTTIHATLYDSSTKKKHNVLVAQVFVINESEMTAVSSAEDLIAIKEDLGGWYVLKANIDLDGAEWQGLGTFTGMLVNSGEFVISNLSGTTGLFAANEGYISGIILENVSINKTSDDEFIQLGTIASINTKGATIANCSVKGVIKSSGVTGGIVGYNTSSIINCSFDGMVTSQSNRTADEILESENFYDVAGGIVGINSGIVVHSTAKGQISSMLIAGGVVGIHFTAMSDGRVVNCDFDFVQELPNRIVAPIWGRTIGWEQTLVNRV